MSKLFVNTISPYTGNTVTIDCLVITGNTNITSLSATTISATTYQNLPVGVIAVSGTTLYSTSPATSNFSGTDSIFLGANAGSQATGATYSNFLGYQAGSGATNANNSNFLGYQAGYGATNASYSNLFGFNVGKTFTGNNLGSNNIIIGTNISLPNTTANAINIGGVLFGTGTYSTTGGNPLTATTASGKIGIQVVTPTSTLDVSGTTGYNQLRLRTTYTPTGSTDTNGNIGDISWDNTYIYWKTSTQWLRVSGVTW